MEDKDKTETNLSSPEKVKLKLQVDKYDKIQETESTNTICDIDDIKSGDDSQCVQPLLMPYCPPGLEPLLEASQIVIHKENLRINQEVNKRAVQRLEVVDETRKVLYTIEQLVSQDVDEDADDLKAFKYVVYSRSKQEVMSVLCPSSTTCVCCHTNWHCSRCCQLQAVVYCPPGLVAGFVKREHTWFVQALEVLDNQEIPILRLRGALNDMGVYSADLETDLGRLAVHGWVGIMHELKRSALDWGLTFPIDLDIRMKCVLLAAVLVIDWLNEKGR